MRKESRRPVGEVTRVAEDIRSATMQPTYSPRTKDADISGGRKEHQDDAQRKQRNPPLPSQDKAQQPGKT